VLRFFVSFCIFQWGMMAFGFLFYFVLHTDSFRFNGLLLFFPNRLNRLISIMKYIMQELIE